MLKRLLLAGLLLVCGEGARAAIIVTLDHVTDFDWVYNVSLQSSAFMSVGDAFTVYDFPGLQEAVFTPDAGPAIAGRSFELTQAGTGFTPSFVVPNDLPGLENVTVKLSGGDPVVPDPSGGALLLGQLTLTGLAAQPGKAIDFTGLSAQQSGGTAVSNIASVPAPVPEPTTVGFMGLGLLAVTALALRRRKPS